MIFVDKISTKVTCSGFMFTVFGGFFNSGCKVMFGDYISVIDSFSENFITVVVPNVRGLFTVYVVDENDNYLNVGDVKVGDTLNFFVYNFVYNYSKDDFHSLVESLFPKGLLFDFSGTSFFNKLISGISFVLLYVWELVRSMMNAMDPFHTENFDDWETELGLPKVGVQTLNDESRRREIYRVGFASGGCSVNFFKKILNIIEVNAKIYEFWYNPEKFSGINFGDDDPNFYWMIEIDAGDDRWFVCTCNDNCNDYLQYWWDSRVENLFDTIKPAHTKIVYSYNYEPCVYLIDDQMNYVVDDNGDRVVSY